MEEYEYICELQEENKQLEQRIADLEKQLEDKTMYERAYYNLIGRQ